MTIVNASPQYRLLGIQDVSGRRVDPEPEQLPIHAPHVMMLMERGPEEAQWVGLADAQRIFGDKSFDYRSEYATHATALVKEAFAPNAQQMLLQRLCLPGAKKAVLGLGIEVLFTKIPEYQREPDGSLSLDPDKKPIPTGQEIDGCIARWKVAPFTREFGQGKPEVGTLVGKAGEESKFYPFFDLEVSTKGKYGDNVGLRMWAPHANSAQPVNERLAEGAQAYPFNIQFVERPDARSTPNVITSLDDEQYVTFGLRPDMYFADTDREYYGADTIIPSYHDDDISSGYAPVYGPFGRMHFYQANIDKVLGDIFALEHAVNPLVADKYLLSILDGLDIDGNPYHALQVQGILDGGASLVETATYYAGLGSDGTVPADSTLEETFDKMVGNELRNYGTLYNEFLDIGRFPQSVLYDSGFSIDTKKAFFKVLSARKDVYVVVGTQDSSLPQNTQTDESSIALSLRTAAEMQPESELYGTSVVRAVIVGQSGYLSNSKWKRLVPATFQIAHMYSAYGGAGTGILDGRKAPDIHPNNKITMLSKLNTVFKSDRVRNKDWDNGMTFAQTYDRRSFFYAAQQTVYKDDTSILNVPINMMIAVECQKVCFRTWRDLTGRSDLTPLEYAQRSDEAILENCRGRFDNRVVIRPETTRSKADIQRGYSNQAKIHMYGNNATNVTSFTVVAHRREELNDE